MFRCWIAIHVLLLAACSGGGGGSSGGVHMLNGTQYVVVALGRGDDVTEFVALTL